MIYRVISTIILAIVVFVLSTALFFGDSAKRSTKAFLVFVVIAQIMAIGHVWN